MDSWIDTFHSGLLAFTLAFVTFLRFPRVFMEPGLVQINKIKQSKGVSETTDQLSERKENCLEVSNARNHSLESKITLFYHSATSHL